MTTAQTLFWFFFMVRVIRLPSQRISISGSLKKSGGKQCDIICDLIMSVLEMMKCGQSRVFTRQQNGSYVCVTPYPQPSSKHGQRHIQHKTHVNLGTGLRSVSQDSVPQRNLYRQEESIITAGGTCGFHMESMIGSGGRSNQIFYFLFYSLIPHC